MTYDISGSGFDDATSEMQLQLGGEERERDASYEGVCDQDVILCFNAIIIPTTGVRL